MMKNTGREGNDLFPASIGNGHWGFARERELMRSIFHGQNFSCKTEQRVCKFRVRRDSRE